MTEDRDQWADNLSAEHSGGWLTGFFAEEKRFDRRAKLRLASWGVGAVGAVTLAILASQFSAQSRREQMASADLLARQAQQLELVVRQTQTDSLRLSAAIDTLNSDRDRLYSRVTSVEQGLESVTGTIKRQAAAVVAPPPASPSAPTAAAPPAPAHPAATEAHGLPPVTPPPLVGPVATAPPVQLASVKPASKALPQVAADKPVAVVSVPVLAEAAPKSLPVIGPTLMPAPLMAEKSMMAPPDSAAQPLSEPPRKITEKLEKSDKTDKPATVIASVQPADVSPAVPDLPAIPVPRTEFGVDLGSANSIDGLRALWRGMVAAHKVLGDLRPIIVLRERSDGLGMQLRLVAGPLGDAAAAAKVCARLSTGERSCETSVFEGQRLSLKSETPVKSEPPAKADSTATVPPRAPARSGRRKRAAPPVEQHSEAPAAKPEEPAPKPQPSLTSFLGLR
ncbi:hypothetical protein BH11PSE4_BH11PSE4_11730 [soil metagenome]